LKYHAVVFDLFGTLVDNYSYEGYQELLRTNAMILGVPAEDFRRLWSETTRQRDIGAITFEAGLMYICDRLGVGLSAEQVGRVTAARRVFLSKQMTPRTDAVSTVAELRRRGLRTALTSNCGPVVPEVWDSSPLAGYFDKALFSCSAGVAKPDRRIYEMALDALNVTPDRCLYVGDGDSQELTGAAAVGMHPVMICVPYEDDTQPHLTNRQKWDGPVISSLADVLKLL
jgi:putative hydrolase of the HAD superfamily